MSRFVRFNWSKRTMKRLILASIALVLIYYIIQNQPFINFLNMIRKDSDQSPYSVKTFSHGLIPGDFMMSNETYNLMSNNLELNLVTLQIPLTVHYFWCHDKQFEFQHYLSIFGAFRFLKPTRIIFHYYVRPKLDTYGYYQYFGDLFRYIPVIVEEKLSEMCSDASVRKNLILKTLNERGGIYIGETTILTNSLSWFRNLQFSYSPGFELILMKRGAIGPSSVTSFLKSTPSNLICVHQNNFKHSTKISDCVIINSEIFPKDIMTLDSEFGRLTRWIYYGSKKLRTPQIQEGKMAPLIVHYVWLGKRPFTFDKYLGLLSSVYVLKAEFVYIHGDVKPIGPYWDEAKRIPNVKFIFREFPTSVFGNEIIKWASHASDVLRADILIRYGGIYCDWDVLWVNPIPERLRKYDAIVSIDWPGAGKFPDIFNPGVLIAQKGSKYMQYFLESYRYYLDNDWTYNAVYMPYKIYEQHSDLVLEEPHLQVICANQACHPTWLPGYNKYSHLNKLKFDWRNETMCIHITYPDPSEYESPEALHSSDSMFGDIGKFVMKRAGLH
ncbi:hypothetical protein LOTGIDRAFT_227856 [Lottia gigantea]|uniref:Uncharacterized protein n=1 Tax=Lottia gigantea TaxID=225164 RepID=V4BGY1_LOTGI|nr:hypothetical protein LOTGIDRAFT_227856 [Lottia gigantea]ESP05182.1 hypothetical protein LOTGIDRAFT_227856 [Lottia gigantea]